VSLNIKNERVHELAREVARRTGQSQTSAIEAALRAYLAQLDRAQRVHRLDALIRDMQQQVAAAGGLRMAVDDLYDERGLPA
jgi:antitoxin VapB